MKQVKRFGDYRTGRFTEWNRSHNGYCIYCGDKATTREHIPSKVFIEEQCCSANLPKKRF